MNVFDFLIVLLIISGMVVGFKRGFTRQLVSSIGFILVVILSFMLKNPVSIFLYEHLPFFKFAGVIKGVTVLNIFFYEVIAFLFIMSILTIGLKLLIHFTNIFEGLLKVTIVLAPISKIGGAIIGAIEAYVWAFLIFYVLSMPVIHLPEFDHSKLKDKILNNTLVLSGYIDDSLIIINEFADIKDKYELTPNASEFNRETLDLFLKYNVVTVDSIDTLVSKGKLKVDNIEDILEKYRNNK